MLSLAQTSHYVSIVRDSFLSNKPKSFLQNGVSRARLGLPPEGGGGVWGMVV